MTSITPSAWGRDPMPLLPSTRTTYDCPAGGLDPFDVTEPRTQYVLDARGLGRAWVAPEDPNARFFGLDEAEFDEKLQPGYKYVRILEKLAVVSEGRLLREWSPTDRPTHEEKFYVGMLGYDVYFQTLRGVNRYKKDWHQAARSQDDWHRSTFVTGERLTLSQADYEGALALALSFPPGIDSAMFVGRVLTHYSYH